MSFERDAEGFLKWTPCLQVNFDVHSSSIRISLKNILLLIAIATF